MTTSRRSALFAPLALLLAIQPAVAQAPAAASTTSQTAKSKPSHFLWEVKSKTATVYLLGSVHIANPSMYPLDAAIEQAFARADTLVLETPMDAAAQQRAAALMQQAGMYTPPDSLDKHIAPKELARLDKALGALGLPSLAVMSMRPWLVSLTLTLLKLQTLGFRPELGIDQHFHAAAGKKRVAALETLEQQVALFRDLPEPLQVAALRQTLAQLDELPDLMRRAVEAWRRGDLAAFEKLLVEPTRKDYPDLYRRLIVDRNRGMAATIGGYLAGTGTTFVVVGGGHLVGRDSIVRMLETAGHKPTQL